MTERTLILLLEGEPAGRLLRQAGRTRLVYEEAWRHSPAAVPLSLSLPLAKAEYPPKAVEPVLWGLLPDNDEVLARWGRRFFVSPRNVFALLSHVGEDCAGAVQFVPPDRLAGFQASVGEVEWLDEGDIARRLRDLRADPAAGRLPQDPGQFSLAGAQPKTALLLRDGCWGVPSGRIATTHILKPSLPYLPGHAENEHFCLSLARALGLTAVRSEVRHFGEETAILVERYDRLPDGEALGGILRVHQEDFCQALGLGPGLKYQSEGGPAPADILGLLRRVSDAAAEDQESFLAALAFNWLVAGPDAHAKNYALLLAGGGQVRLAPLYDLASVLPYPSFDPRRVKLAMKIGGSDQLDDIGRHQWRKLAAELSIEADALEARLVAMAEALPDAAADGLARLRDAGLTHPILPLLAEALSGRARDCLARLRA